MKILRRWPDSRLILLAGFIVLIANLGINGRKDYSRGLLAADARGYYAYLPAVFIYHDLNLGFFDTMEKGRYYNPNLFYEFRTTHNGKTIDKYYAGTAVCLSPFFLAGHVITTFTNQPRDGYSRYYVHAVSLACIVYLVLTLFLLNKVLKMLNISTANRMLSLMIMLFGTNLFYYNIAETCLSHGFSLTFFSLFIYSSLRFFRGPSPRMLLIMGFSLGMITLIRPVNLLIIISLPFLAGDAVTLRRAWQWLGGHLFPVLLALMIFAIIIAIQLIIYRVQTGSWLVYSYKGEGFDFSHPQIIPILFSYRKGLFLYTPVYLLSLVGLYYIYRQQRQMFGWWLLFFLPVLYVLSSWHNWYYGGSFSGRVFIEFLPYFLIPLAFALQNIRKSRVRKCYIGILLLLTLVCQVQTYQYCRGQIHWSEQTREKYWENFLGHRKLEKLF